ncbi:MAG: lamin tail domain-containing protein, partial [Bacteroidota bacterium]
TWFNGFAACTGNGGSGNMMVFDGSTINNDKVWCQKVPVKPGQTYTFTYFVQSLVTSNLANLEVQINGVSLTPPPNPQSAPSTTCSWQQRTYTWNAGANSLADICIYNRVTTSAGNDFALDDISFTTSLTCNLSKNITITVNNCGCTLQLANPVSAPNTNCNPTPCNYTGPKVVINELHIQPNPTATNQAIVRRSDLTNGEEWIELYNPSPCQALDLSCYMLGNYSTEGSGTVIAPAVLFLPPGTTIPPLGFLTIGGAGSPATLKPNNLINGLVGNILYLPGGIFDGGWLGIWDANGTNIDAVYWMDPSRTITSTFATGSFTTSPGTITNANVPFSCPYRGTLPTARQLNTGGLISRIGNIAGNGRFQYRSVDGGNTWVFTGTTNTANSC